ncbi:MAG: hypothetical protein WAL71_07260, partial [Terriglobales bacterium]
MRRRNDNVLLLFLLLITCCFANAQAGAPAPAAPPGTSPAPAADQANGSASAQPSAPANQAPPQNATPAPDSSDNSGVFVFKKEVEEVVLHATVIDNKQHIVTNLDKSSFSVFEDGHPQTITSFRHEDIPVAMCIVVD